MSASLSTTDDFEFDLDAARTARREGGKKVPALRIGGQRYELPVELPVDVLAPLTEVDVDVSILVRMIMDARNNAAANGQGANEAMMETVVDLVVANPALPIELVATGKTIARRFLGDDCYEALVEFRPAIVDLVEIIRHVGRQYGVGLGEALPSSDSSEGTGTTSKPTSRGGTRRSTSGASGKSRARQGS